MRGLTAYRSTLMLPELRPWALLLLCQRLSVAMAPVGLIYLGQAGSGSLSRGSLLVGVHAIAEAVCAAPLGRRFDRRPMKREFTLVLMTASGFFVLAAALAPALPIAVVVAVVACGGGVAAGAHGALRALAMRLAPHHVRPVLGVESSLNTLMWLSAPVLAVFLAEGIGNTAPVWAIAAFCGLGAVTARFLTEPATAPVDERAGVPWTRLLPACGQSAAAMLAVGALTVSLFGLLPLLGADTTWAGTWLSVMAGMGVLGGIWYSSRQWPGRPVVQTAVLLSLLCAAVITAGIVGNVVAGFALIMIIGVLQPAVGASRSLAVQDRVPQGALSAAFSATYACAGLGYGAAGLLAAALLSGAGPREAVVACAGIALLIAVLSGIAEARQGGSSPETDGEVEQPGFPVELQEKHA
ncbi:MFS transporter [Streptomyces sp. NPDC004126]|uniref:MFS transporter n=1 Tax=Streptomyces sp. NPDC004126 TaxID=3390695 RepID=UPI003CFBCA8B